MAESEELKNLLINVKEESKNVGLKLNIQKTKIIHQTKDFPLVESTDAEAQICKEKADYKELEHPWVLVSVGVIESIHCGCRRITVLCKLKEILNLNKSGTRKINDDDNQSPKHCQGSGHENQRL